MTTTEFRIDAQGPYRSASSAFLVDDEMRAACDFIRQWQKYEPVISGGALWAWAAGKLARDVDIFFQEGFWLKRKLRKLYGPSVQEIRGLEERIGDEDLHGEYKTFVGVGRAITRYKARLTTGTEVDLVLTPWRGVDVITQFDYAHCMVAFGADQECHLGASFYHDDSLNPRNSRARSKEVIKSKIQKDLWGSPEAKIKLFAVMDKLKNMYWSRGLDLHGKKSTITNRRI